MMRRMLIGCAALLAVTGLVGCSSESEPRPTPSKITPTPPPDVPIAGPENSPITWMLDRGVSASDPRVVSLQRFIAFDTYVTSLPEDRRDGDDAAVLASGYDALAAGEELLDVVNATTGYLRGGVRTGPLWIRLSERQTSDSAVRLVACSDQRHHTFAGEPVEKNARPFATTYTLRKTNTDWKVSQARTAASADQARCRSWDISDHEPR